MADKCGNVVCAPTEEIIEFSDLEWDYNTDFDLNPVYVQVIDDYEEKMDYCDFWTLGTVSKVSSIEKYGPANHRFTAVSTMVVKRPLFGVIRKYSQRTKELDENGNTLRTFKSDTVRIFGKRVYRLQENVARQPDREPEAQYVNMDDLVFDEPDPAPAVVQGGSQSKTSNKTEAAPNAGTQVFNYYNNQYQNSVDLSSLASGVGEQNSHHPLFDLFGQAASSLPMMLMDPTTEEALGMPDRIGQTIAGATGIVNQNEVGTVALRSGACSTVSSCADAPSGDEPLLNRWVEVSSFNWVQNDQAGRLAWYSFPTALPECPAKLLFDRHAIVRCGWRFLVTVNASSFHTGCLLIAAVPELQNKKTSGPTGMASANGFDQAWAEDLGINYQQLTLGPHQFINLRSNSTAQIEVPYCNVAPGSMPGMHCPWRLLICVVSPLGYATGASTIARVVVQACPTGVQMHGLRKIAAAQVFPFRITGSPFMAISTEPDSEPPVYGKAIRGSDDFLPGRIENFMQVLRVPTLMECNTNLSSGNRPFFELSTSASRTLAWEMNMSLTAQPFLTTALRSAARSFSSYRGTIQLHFMFVGAAQTRGRLAVTYTPPGTTKPTTYEEAAQATLSIWELGVQSTFSVPVPYISVTDFRYIHAGVYTTLNVDGWVQVWTVTNLTFPPGVPTQARVVVMASAGDDFCLRNPIDRPLTQVLENPEAGVSEDQNAASNFRAEALKSYYQDTDPAYLFNRFMYCDKFDIPAGSVVGADGGTKFATVSLTVQQLQKMTLFHNMTCFTYFTCDLSIRLIPQKNLGLMVVHHIPEGQPAVTTTTNNIADSLRNQSAAPLIVASPNPAVDFSVPFNSVLSALCTSYNGFADLNRTQYGVCPSNSFGTLKVGWLSPNSEQVTVLMYCKLTNFKCYVPRPFPRRSNSSTRAAEVSHNELETFLFSIDDPCEGNLHQSECDVSADGSHAKCSKHLGRKTCCVCATSNMCSGQWSQKKGRFCSSEENHYYCENHLKEEMCCVCRPHEVYAQNKILLSGDVELNPGPLAQVQTLLKLLDSGLARDAGETSKRAADLVDRAHGYLDLIDSTIMTLPTWGKVLKKIFKTLMDLVILMRTDDPVISAVVSINSLLDLAGPDGLMTWIIKKIRHCFSTPPPAMAQAPVSKVKSLNDKFQLAKNVEWALSMIGKVLDWLKAWVQQEKVSPIREFQEKLADFPHHEARLREAKHPHGVEASLKYMEEIAEMAKKLEKFTVAKLAEDSYKHLKDSRVTRPEPVVVVIHGDPGQGKSVAAQLAARAVSKLLTGHVSYYSLPPDPKYFDGYNGQTVVLMDDLGQNPDGKDMSTFCQMVSTTDFFPPMADLPDKGMKFTSPIIIATTNQPVFTPVTVSDPKAIERRIYLDLRIAVSKKFQDKTGRLDMAKAFETLSTPAPAGFDVNVPFLTEAVAFFDNGIGIESGRMTFKELVDKIVAKFLEKTLIADALTAVVQNKKSLKEKISYLEKNHSKELEKLYAAVHNPVADELSALDLTACVIAGFSMFVSVAGMIIALFRLFSAAVQGPYSDVPSKRVPQPADLREVNLEVGEVSFELSILRNVVPITFIREDGTTLEQSALGTHELSFFVNKHSMDNPSWVKFEINGHTYQRDVGYRAVKYNSPRGPLDLYHVHLKKGTRFRDIRKHFVEKGKQVPKGAEVTGIVNTNDIPRLIFSAPVVGYESGVNTNAGLIPWVVRYKHRTQFGFCGGPIIADFGGIKKIIAIHCAGTGYTGLGAVVNTSMLTTGYEAEAKTQAIIYWHPDGDRTYIPRKTQLELSPLANEIDFDVEPAVLSQKDKRLEDGIDFEQVVLSKHSSDMKNLPPEFEAGWKIYADQVFSIIGKENGLVTVEEAINGDDILEPMDLRRSPGLPYTKQGLRRLDLVKKVGDKYYPTERLLSDIIDIQEDEDYEPTFMTFLKDELRPREKVRAGKTRIIDAAPFNFAIWGRMLLNRFSGKFFKANGTGIGSAIGCNPDVDWTRYYYELAARNVLAFDYSGFDASHPPEMFAMASLYFFNQENGFHPDCSRFLQNLRWSHHVFDSKRFSLLGGLPSGTPCTSLLNTVFNNVIILTAVFSVYRNVNYADLRLLCYGDDLLLSTNQEISPKHLATWLNENTSYKITPADKSDCFLDGTKIEDVTFLKRHFVPDEQNPILVHPRMEKQNILNILSHCRKGTFQEKLKSVELLAYHNGEEFYNEIRNLVLKHGFEMDSFQVVDFFWRDQFYPQVVSRSKMATTDAWITPHVPDNLEELVLF